MLWVINSTNLNATYNWQAPNVIGDAIMAVQVPPAAGNTQWRLNVNGVLDGLFAPGVIQFGKPDLSGWVKYNPQKTTLTLEKSASNFLVSPVARGNGYYIQTEDTLYVNVYISTTPFALQLGSKPQAQWAFAKRT